MTNTMTMGLSEIELQKMINHTDKIKTIIINNLTKLIENEEIEKISTYSQLYSILKPFDSTLNESLKIITSKTLKEEPKTIVVNKPKRKMGRPKGSVSISKQKTMTKQLELLSKPIVVEEDTKNRKVGRPKTRIDLKPINKKLDNYSLDYDFTSTKPLSYSLNGNQFKIKSWKHLFEDAVTNIILSNAKDIDKILNSPLLKGNKLEYVSKSSKNMRSPLKLVIDGEKIFIETYGSSNVLMELIQRIMTCLDIDKNIMTVQLKDK